MNRSEYLLTCLSEEASEIIQDASKSLRFGLTDTNPKTSIKNREALRLEIIDFIAVAEMLVSENIIDPFDEISDIYLKEEKKEKVEKYILYSQDVGTYDNH